jgi:hypothetical protein
MALRPVQHMPHIVDNILQRLGYGDLISLSQASRTDRILVGPPAARAAFEDKLAFVMYAEGTFFQHFPRTSGLESPGNFACFWCFRVRAPKCFDNWQDNVFWNLAEQRVERVGEEQQQQQQSPSLSSPSSSSYGAGFASPHHGHYSQYQQHPAYGQQILPPHPHPPTPSPSPKQLQPVPARLPHQDPRVLDGQLAGLRRFCIDCGLDNMLYRPGDTIQTKARDCREMWVCSCRCLQAKTHTKCEGCGDIAPMRPRKRYY